MADKVLMVSLNDVALATGHAQQPYWQYPVYCDEKLQTMLSRLVDHYGLNAEAIIKLGIIIQYRHMQG